MILQICMPEHDKHVHRVLRRNIDASKDPDIYRLLKVTFGHKPSPDMVSFIMLKIVEENREKFPDAAIIRESDRYVDDLMHSCASSEKACQRMTQLDEAFAIGSLQIKQWIFSGDRDASSEGKVCRSPPSEINLDNEDARTLVIC